MKKINFTLIIIILSTYCFGQIKTLDFAKFNDCIINVEIHYKDREKDYVEAQKYKDIEIILIQANKDGKVKSFKRGYISTLVKGDYKGTFFESVESKNSNKKTAEFPLFADKKYYCYKAKCYDTIENK